MKYAAVVKESYWQEGYDNGDPGSTVYYDKFVEFDNKESLTKFLLRDGERSSYDRKVKRVIQFEELTYTTEVVIKGL